MRAQSRFDNRAVPMINAANCCLRLADLACNSRRPLSAPIFQQQFPTRLDQNRQFNVRSRVFEITRSKNVIAFILGLTCLVLGGLRAAEASCSLPYTLTNGQTADATQVMANFNALVSCLSSNGSVNSGTTGQIGYYAATGTAISRQGLSALLDSNFGSTRGSILFRGASGWTPLAPGSAGQVLTSAGTGADPAWAAGGGSGGSLGIVPYFGPTGGTWTRPAGTAFSWINQGSATYTDNSLGGPLVMAKAASSSDSLSLLCVSAPTTPYTYTVMVTSPAQASSNYTVIGLALYDSGSGKVTTLGFGNSSAAAYHWNSTSSWNSTVKSFQWAGTLLWMRISNDGTSLTYYISVDDVQWMQLATESVTAFMPAITNICWGNDPHDNQYTSMPLYSELWQWTSP
jgi:hypothetical protein